MNLRNPRLFHHLAATLVLTGCTIERIDLGGIDTIPGEVTADPTAHSATTTWVHTDAPDSTCLAYKDDDDSKLIPCSETTNAVAAGYCVLQNIDLPNQPTICPGTPVPPLEPSSTTGDAPTTLPGPESTTTAVGACTYIVENGSTVAVGCTTSAPSVSCAVVDDAGELIAVPCDDTSPACATLDTAGNIVPVPCGGTHTVPSCSGTVVTGETPPPCDATTAPVTSIATTTTLASDAPTTLPPPEESDDTEPLATDEPDLVDAGAAPSAPDAAAL